MGTSSLEVSLNSHSFNKYLSIDSEVNKANNSPTPLILTFYLEVGSRKPRRPMLERGKQGVMKG